MGVQESHERKYRYYPNHYPLLSLKKHNGTLAVGGGPVYGGVARDRGLEGVLTLWEQVKSQVCILVTSIKRVDLSICYSDVCG